MMDWVSLMHETVDMTWLTLPKDHFSAIVDDKTFEKVDNILSMGHRPSRLEAWQANVEGKRKAYTASMDEVDLSVTAYKEMLRACRGGLHEAKNFFDDLVMAMLSEKLEETEGPLSLEIFQSVLDLKGFRWGNLLHEGKISIFQEAFSFYHAFLQNNKIKMLLLQRYGFADAYQACAEKLTAKQNVLNSLLRSDRHFGYLSKKEKMALYAFLLRQGWLVPKKVEVMKSTDATMLSLSSEEINVLGGETE